MKVGVASADEEFRAPDPLPVSEDWSPVIDALAKHKGSRPLIVHEVIPDNTPEKNVARALAGKKRSLEKALSKLQGPNGRPLTDFVEVGYNGTRNLAVRIRAQG